MELVPPTVVSYRYGTVPVYLQTRISVGDRDIFDTDSEDMTCLLSVEEEPEGEEGHGG